MIEPEYAYIHVHTDTITLQLFMYIETRTLLAVKLCVKVAPLFPIHYFPQTNSLGNKRTYIIINASNEGICVEFERKTTLHWFYYFQIACKY